MSANSDQQEFWSNKVGGDWVTWQSVMDASFRPVLDLVLERAALQTGQSVLDIGCGAGTSSLLAADLVGTGGQVLGADISEPLLKQARATAQGRPNLNYVLGDAQTHAFAPQSFDHLISRFGVMFFEDSVVAFQNMAKALRPGAKITLACWGPAPNNPWFMMPAKVAQMRMGKPPKSDRTLPGPFAFEDQARVTESLTAAGLRDVKATTHNLLLTPPGDACGFADQQAVIGPVKGIIEYFNGTAQDWEAIHAGIIEACGAFQTPQGLRIPSDINLFEARV